MIIAGSALRAHSRGKQHEHGAGLDHGPLHLGNGPEALLAHRHPRHDGAFQPFPAYGSAGAPVIRTAPTYLVIGHVCQDFTPFGVKWGGTAMFGATTAFRLGARVHVLTSTLPSAVNEALPPGVQVHNIPTHVPLTFRMSRHGHVVISHRAARRCGPRICRLPGAPWISCISAQWLRKSITAWWASLTARYAAGSAGVDAALEREWPCRAAARG